MTDSDAAKFDAAKKERIFMHKEHQLNSLRNIQDPLVFEIGLKKKTSLMQRALNKIPMLSKLWREFDVTGDAVTKLGERIEFFEGSKSNESIHQGFHIAGIIIALIDFVRIPIIYLAAYLLKEAVPITLNNNARWLYSGVILGLALTALIVPGAASVIGFIGATMGFAVASFLLAKSLVERYQLGKQQRQVKRELRFEEEELIKIQLDAAALHERLLKTEDEQELTAHYLDTAIVLERFELQKQRVTELKIKEQDIAQKIKELQLASIINRTIPIILAALSIIGLIVAMFIPPVGASILTGVAVAGLSYIAVRLVVPVVKLLRDFIMGKASSNAQTKVNQNELERDKLYKKDNPKNDLYAHESTADVLEQLGGVEAEPSTKLKEGQHLADEPDLKSASKLDFKARIPRPDQENKDADLDDDGQRKKGPDLR